MMQISTIEALKIPYPLIREADDVMLEQLNLLVKCVLELQEHVEALESRDP